jgi:predicted metalloprotease with PDZ domain
MKQLIKSMAATSACIKYFLGVYFLLMATVLVAQKKTTAISFTVSMPQPASHLYHVLMDYESATNNTVELKMPAWTTGYYQILDFANNVADFSAKNKKGEALQWEKTSKNSWTIHTEKGSSFSVSYTVKGTDRIFVASNYLDEERGYISPAGMFLHPAGMIQQPVSVTIIPNKNWSKISTGLDLVKGTTATYLAADYDVLYDSPILMANLESLPSFTVKGIPHYFDTYKPADFDKAGFMNDIKKIVVAASDIIGDIPYTHYTFLGLGPGGGGIEHLNSSSISFDGKGLTTKEARIGTYNFLAHEYFHHYNVKRIRPVELGPFDYDKGSVTKMLWLSEGITVYYEYIILKRAGLTNSDDVFKTFQSSIKSYESKPGRSFQTPADASYNTWSEGPFGRTGDEVNKTISPYDKGPALGLLLDFKIRHETKNKQSLDALMRILYNKYYKQKNRGFTEDEFRKEAEKLAGVSLSDFFDYIYTLKTVDYPTYLGYAGLSIDTTAKEIPGAWIGISVRDRNDSLSITNVEWQSPAWNKGLRNRNILLEVNGNKLNAKQFNDLLAASKPGDSIKLLWLTSSGKKEEEIRVANKKERSFEIKRISNPDALQKTILNSWLAE